MYRILLVDDEALTREGVSENVPWEKCGYELAGSCENGKEALAFIRSQPVDVVITDICMPFMDGMKLTELLHSEFPEIQIVILSGYDDFEYAKKAIKFNVHEYLLKPITSVEMCRVLEGLKRRMDEAQERNHRLTRMQTNYYKGQILLYSNVLLNLITGSKSEEESRQELQEVGMNLEALVYRVGIVELDVYSKTAKPDEKMKKESALMAFVVQNISQEIVKKHGTGEVCQGKDQRAFILFYANKREGFEARTEETCKEIVDQMFHTMKLAVNIGLGSCVHEMREIYLSCEKAEQALDYNYVMNQTRIFDIKKLVADQEQDEQLWRKEREEALLANQEAILLHVKENAQGELAQDTEGLKEIFVHKLFDRRAVGTSLQRIVQSADEIFRASEPEEIPELLKQEPVLREMLEAGEMDKAVNLLLAYLRRLADFLDGRRNTGGKKYAVLAMDYLEKNYGDCDLGLGSVCSYLNISISRFSSIFKNTTGQTFMDALSNIRMQKAMELLENTDMKNYEIAEKVGFNDPHYFSFAFKKFTGKTPTEYAKEMRR